MLPLLVCKRKCHPFQKFSSPRDMSMTHIVSLHCYLQRLDTARWSRRAHPWTWWTAGPGTPRRRPRKRPLREPSGPALPGATLREENIYTSINQSKCPDFTCGRELLMCGGMQNEIAAYHFLWRTHTTRFLWSCRTYSCTTGLSSPCHPTPTRTLKKRDQTWCTQLLMK